MHFRQAMVEVVMLRPDHPLREKLPPEVVEIIDRPWFPVAFWADSAVTTALVGVGLRAAGLVLGSNVFFAVAVIFVLLALRAAWRMRG